MVRTAVKRFISESVEVVSTNCIPIICRMWTGREFGMFPLSFVSVDSKQVHVHFDLYRQVYAGDLVQCQLCLNEVFALKWSLEVRFYMVNELML